MSETQELEQPTETTETATEAPATGPKIEEGKGLLEGFMRVTPGATLLGKEKKNVIITDEFWIGKYEVTEDEYYNFVKEADPYNNREYWCEEGWKFAQENILNIENIEKYKGSKLPVVNVSFFESRAYAAWIQKKMNEENTDEDVIYLVDLPFEAQWEYAARGVDGRTYPWGEEEPTSKHAAFFDTAGQRMPVDSHPLGTSPWGMEDAVGNIWEWTLDVYEEQFPISNINPFNPIKTMDIRRGVDIEIGTSLIEQLTR